MIRKQVWGTDPQSRKLFREIVIIIALDCPARLLPLQLMVNLFVSSFFSSYTSEVAGSLYNYRILSLLRFAFVGAVSPSPKKPFADSYDLSKDLGSGAFSVVKMATHKVV